MIIPLNTLSFKTLLIFFSLPPPAVGHLRRRPILHRRHPGSLPGERDHGRQPLQPDPVLLSGPMPAEGSHVQVLPPPGPRQLGGGVGEGVQAGKQVQGCGTDEKAGGDADGGPV